MNVELDYAPRLPMYQRKWFRRSLAAVVAVVVGAAAYFGAHGWVSRQWHRYWLLQAQEECMNYVADPGRVLYSEDAGEIATLGHAKGYMRVSQTIGSTPPTLKYEYVFGDTVPWQKLAREWEPAGKNLQQFEMSIMDPVVYLHRLKTPSGEEFLARVERMPRKEDELSFVARTHVPLERKENPGEFLWMEQVITIVTPATPPKTMPLRFFAARADGADGMTFTMEYEVGGVKGHIRGTYRQNRPTGSHPLPNHPLLQMEIVDGPLKM
jgi:hypothetical protein